MNYCWLFIDFLFNIFKFCVKLRFMQAKRRNFFFKSPTTFLSKLNLPKRFFFGNAALVPLSFLVLSSLFLTRFILFLKRVARKRDKTLRRYWLAPRSFIRIAYKSKGARMGKGKGKKIIHIQRYPPFINFVEFSGIRPGKLEYVNKQVNARMQVYLTLSYSVSFDVWKNLIFYK